MNKPFHLYDLKVELTRTEWLINSFAAKVWDCFLVQWENLIFPAWWSFSYFNLAAIIPLLAAKQRETDENDWMTTDHEVTGPDPSCKAIFTIKREWKRLFYHEETSNQWL